MKRHICIGIATAALLPVLAQTPTGKESAPAELQAILEELQEIRTLLEKNDARLSRIYEAVEPYLDEIEEEAKDNAKDHAKRRERRHRNANDDLAILEKAFSPLPAEPKLPDTDIISKFTFDEGLFDDVAPIRGLSAKNCEAVAGTLYLNGRYQNAGTGGYRAVAELPGLDYAGFTFAHHFWPIDSRNGDVIIMGGTSYRWFGIVIESGGKAAISMNNGRFKHDLGIVVEPLQWHHITCSVDLSLKTISIILDGTLLPPVSLPEDFKLDVIGSKAEKRDKNITFTNYSSGNVFHGFVDNLRVYSRPLTTKELAEATH